MAQAIVLPWSTCELVPIEPVRLGGCSSIDAHAVTGFPATRQNLWSSTTHFLKQATPSGRRPWLTLGSPVTFLAPGGSITDANSFAASTLAWAIDRLANGVDACAPAVISSETSAASNDTYRLKVLISRSSNAR